MQIKYNKCLSIGKLHFLNVSQLLLSFIVVSQSSRIRIFQASFIAAQLQADKSLQRWCKLSDSKRYFNSDDFLPSLLGLCCRMSLEWLTYLIIRIAPWAGKMNKILHYVIGYPNGQNGRSGLPDVSRRKNVRKCLIRNLLLHKLVRWLLPSFFSESSWTLTPSRSLNLRNKNLGNIQPNRPHPWPINRILLKIGSAFTVLFCCFSCVL